MPSSHLAPIKNCPMCGSRPELKENYTTVGGHLFSGVVCAKCGLAGLHFSTQRGIDMWQEMVGEWEQIESLLEEDAGEDPSEEED